MPQMILTWHNSREHENCPLCDSMDSHQWTFEIGRDPFPTILEFNGVPVWTADHSIAHQSARIKWPCYCMLEITWKTDDMDAKIREIRNTVEAKVK